MAIPSIRRHQIPSLALSSPSPAFQICPAVHRAAVSSSRVWHGRQIGDTTSLCSSRELAVRAAYRSYLQCQFIPPQCPRFIQAIGCRHPETAQLCQKATRPDGLPTEGAVSVIRFILAMIECLLVGCGQRPDLDRTWGTRRRNLGIAFPMLAAGLLLACISDRRARASDFLVLWDGPQLGSICQSLH